MSSATANDHSAEPADPLGFDYSSRRDCPLAPESVKISRLPAPFVHEGRAVTVAEAGEAYLKMARANRHDDSLTSKYKRHRRGLYPRILEADRHFRKSYDGLSTVMLTRRLSPRDENGGCWLTPWECNEALHGGGVQRSVLDALRYQLGQYDFEWLSVTAPTTSAGTPHEHMYLWVEDPDNSVTVDHISPALDKHLDHCPTAYRSDHQYRADGTAGSITVRHAPPLIDALSDSLSNQFFKIAEQSDAAGDGEYFRHTKGAQYIASQLAHLPVGDCFDESEGQPWPLLDGAALAWASPRDWFRASRGVPS